MVRKDGVCQLLCQKPQHVSCFRPKARNSSLFQLNAESFFLELQSFSLNPEVIWLGR